MDSKFSTSYSETMENCIKSGTSEKFFTLLENYKKIFLKNHIK